MEEKQRNRTFNIATLVSVILLLVFAFNGLEILNIFGLSIYSFQVAGGILLLIMAIRVLILGNSREEGGVNRKFGSGIYSHAYSGWTGGYHHDDFNLQSYGTFSSILAVLIVLSLHG